MNEATSKADDHICPEADPAEKVANEFSARAQRVWLELGVRGCVRDQH